jgi:hypothetical protein
LKKLILLSSIAVFLIFLNSNYVHATTKTDFPGLHRHIEKNEIEGYYLSEPLDGETESCSLSVKIRKVKGGYVFTFDIDGKIAKGMVKLTKSDDPKEFGITFKGIHWAENNGDISRPGQQNKLKLPDGIEGVWSAAGIVIQNYGNAMNSYMQIASCGQKYINLVKQDR